MNAAPPVMLFDGVCNLCNASVNFVLDRDRDARLRFASLQSASARELLTARGVAAPEGDPDSMVLIEGDRVWVRSDAVLRVCRHLPWPWRAASVLLIVPRALRDARGERAGVEVLRRRGGPAQEQRQRERTPHGRNRARSAGVGMRQTSLRPNQR